MTSLLSKLGCSCPEEKVSEVKKPKRKIDVQEDVEIEEEIWPEEHPTKEKWVLVPLYHDDAAGRKRIWQVGFDGSHIFHRYGLVDGAIQTSRKEVVPKSNRTLLEQALQQARYDFTIYRRDKNYAPAGEQPREFEPMLGHPLFHTKKVKGETVTVQRPIKTWPVAVQAKLDGFRMYCYLDDDNEVRCFSRKHVEQDHLKHLRKQLKPYFYYLPRGAILDGELYSHSIVTGGGDGDEEHKGKRAKKTGGKFNALQSIISSKVNIHPELKKIEYYIFDLYYPESGPYNERYIKLIETMRTFFDDGNDFTHIFALTMTLAFSMDDIFAFHNEFVKMGYEGIIIKKIYFDWMKDADYKASLYKFTRTVSMLKHKNFFDEEGVVVDVIEGTGKEKGAAIFIVEDSKGNVFRVRPRGSIPERQKIFTERDDAIGRKLTYRFQEKSEYDIPRFPVGIGFRSDV